MLTRSELEQIISVCKAIGDETADEDGFVPIKSLLRRFRTSLEIRPMLVEGMLASIDLGASINGDKGWTVLIDSETHQIAVGEIDVESSTKPLPNRFRNTVAHELVHSLALRPTDFNIRFKEKFNENDPPADLVRQIERETERLSPLLLWSRRAMARLLKGRDSPLSIEELVDVQKTMGMSRQVLINRLCMLAPSDEDGLWYSPGLQNIAIGIAEWTVGGTAVIRGWPMFTKFDRNHVPEFLLSTERLKNLDATKFCDDASFAMCGGSNKRTVIPVSAGTAAVPSAEKMTIEIVVEERFAGPGGEFLFTVNKVG